MVDKLPADKATLLIFYCGGLECMLSHNSAFKAEKLGYSNIKVYADGMPDWKAKGGPVSVSTAFIKKLIDDKATYALIDARPKRVADKGMIPTAINISDTDFDKNVDKLPADKATLLIFYCGGLECVLSDKSADKARKLGYTNVRDLSARLSGVGEAVWCGTGRRRPRHGRGGSGCGCCTGAGQGKGCRDPGLVREGVEGESVFDHAGRRA